MNEIRQQLTGFARGMRLDRLVRIRQALVTAKRAGPVAGLSTTFWHGFSG
jgi:hypothetical protein